MSYLKDAKIIKTIAENESNIELSEEACRYILSQTELFLRKLIIEVAKVSKRFTRTKMKIEDIQLILEDLNLSFLSVGSSISIPNIYNQGETSNYELDRSSIPLKEKMMEILKTKLLKKRKIEISFDWLFINGKQNYEIENQLNKNSKQSKQQKNSGIENHLSQYPNFEEFANYDYFLEKNNKIAYMIKLVNPDVLTEEALRFFETYREILEGYFKNIDSDLIEIDYTKFIYSYLISFIDY